MEQVKQILSSLQNHFLGKSAARTRAPRPPFPPNSHNKSQLHFPSKIHYLCNLHPISSHNVNFPLNKVKY